MAALSIPFFICTTWFIFFCSIAIASAIAAKTLDKLGKCYLSFALFSVTLNSTHAKSHVRIGEPREATFNTKLAAFRSNFAKKLQQGQGNLTYPTVSFNKTLGFALEELVIMLFRSVNE